MVNFISILAIVIVSIAIICTLLVAIDLYTTRNNVAYNTASILKSAYYTGIAVVSLQIFWFIILTISVIITFQHDFKKNDILILLIVIAITLNIGIIIFGIVLYIDNKNIYGLANLLLSILNLILSILFLIQIRNKELYVYEQKNETEIDLQRQIEELKELQGKKCVITEPVKEEPLVQFSEIQTVTSTEYIPINNNTEYLRLI